MSNLSKDARLLLQIATANSRSGKEIADAIDAGQNVSHINAIFRDSHLVK